MLAQIKIAPVKSAILIIYDWFNLFVINYLFSDAKAGEYRAEDVVGGYFAGYFAEVVHTFAYVLCYEVGGYAVG